MTQPPPAAPKASGLAIASLICGIAGLVTCGLGALVGLVLGMVALVRISQSQGQMGGQSLAIAGVLVSAGCMVLVVVAGPPLLGLLIIFRQELKEHVRDVWDEAEPFPADDFFGGDLTERFGLPLPTGSWHANRSLLGTIVRKPS